MVIVNFKRVVVSFQTLTTRGRESADTRYLTTHSGGSWFTPWMPTILNEVFCGFPRQKANAGIDPSFSTDLKLKSSPKNDDAET